MTLSISVGNAVRWIVIALCCACVGGTSWDIHRYELSVARKVWGLSA